jgi:hypothetical protein
MMMHQLRSTYLRPTRVHVCVCACVQESTAKIPWRCGRNVKRRLSYLRRLAAEPLPLPLPPLQRTQGWTLR